MLQTPPLDPIYPKQRESQWVAEKYAEAAMTVMGKIGIGVATAVLSAAAVAMLGLGGEGNTTLNINGGNTGGYQATQS